MVTRSEPSFTPSPETSLAAQARQILGTATTLVEQLLRTAGLVSRRVDLRGRVERNPLGTLALAAGVGFVLGGGLITRFSARLVGLGIKLVAVPVLLDRVRTMALEINTQQEAAGASQNREQSARSPNGGTPTT
ncbi:MAG: hypothetical protein AB2A00_26950 [Myxococcota bacterium]